LSSAHRHATLAHADIAESVSRSG